MHCIFFPGIVLFLFTSSSNLSYVESFRKTLKGQKENSSCFSTQTKLSLHFLEFSSSSFASSPSLFMLSIENFSWAQFFLCTVSFNLHTRHTKTCSFHFKNQKWSLVNSITFPSFPNNYPSGWGIAEPLSLPDVTIQTQINSLHPAFTSHFPTPTIKFQLLNP